MLLKTFRFPLAITVLGLAGAAIVSRDVQTVVIVAILAVLEVSLSFDNAVVNATVLRRLNPYWQRLFLTLGILIAVFGMRLVFPIIVVMLSAHLGPTRVIDLALHPSTTSQGLSYQQFLVAAHPAIAAFGGIFLLMIFLDFMFEEREITWLAPVERALARIGKLDQLSVVVALVVLLVSALTFASAHEGQVLISGVAGLATYLAVNGLSSLFETNETDETDGDAGDDGDGTAVKVPAAAGAGGKAGLFLFLYLEVLDASFSFDGVVGAFAITSKIFVIALGLGIGATYIRTLTVYLVRKGTLSEYVFLEHGAHWAIGALAAILIISIAINVPEVVTGLIGVGFIGAAFASSVARRRRLGGGGDPAVEVRKPLPVSTS